VTGLKRLLENSTLIGEYIGHPELESLIHYSQEAINFFAVMDKNPKVVYQMTNSLEILEAHKLPVLPHKSIGVLKTYEDVCDFLLEIHAST